MFVKLIGYADTHGGKLPVPVNMVADEFINIGTIPDFEKKISTARSRNVNIIMIYPVCVRLSRRIVGGDPRRLRRVSGARCRK